jgi:hypothetical protein
MSLLEDEINHLSDLIGGHGCKKFILKLKSSNTRRDNNPYEKERKRQKEKKEAREWNVDVDRIELMLLQQSGCVFCFFCIAFSLLKCWHAILRDRDWTFYVARSS